MDLAGLAALLTVALGFVTAIFAILQDRSRLRTLERLVTLNVTMEPGDGRNSVRDLENIFAARLLRRNSRPLPVKLTASTLVLGIVGSLLVIQEDNSFVFDVFLRLGMQLETINVVRSLLWGSGLVVLLGAIGAFITLGVLGADKAFTRLRRKLGRWRLDGAKSGAGAESVLEG
ncbi:hypothetical protein [Cryobacterium sp. PH31-L1]|uniref:hypothetical protein n=1 Tax=Cryobacterium sp. PH31-L1 TaxID=3046199 RepID=UPI0024BA217C|nr:hypothetical protein [Cryobacterium sp. PH31-L1]MDJ0379208.1 hypothetical protein [Cryobacterium sp. PH31-L1]